jgi:uncharacterized protein
LIRLLVVSDSHGELVLLKKIFKKNAGSYDSVVHLGDGAGDIGRIGMETGVVYLVSGNMDDGSRDLPEVIGAVEMEGIRVLMTHGHHHQVKNTIEELAKEARKRNATLVLYGHTHEQDLTTIKDGTVFFNPGAVKRGSYGVIEIDNGKIVSAIHYQISVK